MIQQTLQDILDKNKENDINQCLLREIAPSLEELKEENIELRVKYGIENMTIEVLE